MSSLSLRPKASLCLLTVLLLAAVAWPAAAAELKISTSSLTFIAVAGRSPGPQQFTASVAPATSGFTPMVLASSQGGNWLAVSSAAGGSFAGSVNVLVSVNSASLAVGNYTGQVTVTQSGLTGSPATVAVSLRVIPAAPYISVNPASLEIAARPGVEPAPVSLAVTNAGTGTLAPSLSASTSSGGNWLVLSQTIGGSFNNSTNVQVQIRSASLPAGTYNGNLTVTAAGATNSPVNVPVKLTIGATGGPLISVSPGALAFTAGLGANPRQQPVTINNTGSGTLRPTVTAATADGGRWLVVSSASGGSFGSLSSLTVAADITGLNKGRYSGTVTITDASAANSPIQVPVTLLVEEPKPVMRLSESSIVFSAPRGAYRLVAAVFVENTGTGLLRWTASVNSQGPQPWLSVLSASGEAPQDSFVGIAADTTGLPPGVYTGAVVFSSNTVSGTNPQIVSVTLAVDTPLPAVNTNGVVNGASFSAAATSPGSIVSIFGAGLGPRLGVRGEFVAGKLPTELAGVKVLFNGIPAPLFYVSEQQLNVQVPMELASHEAASVQVIVNGVPGPPVRQMMRAADPGVFQVGGRPAIFFNGTSTQVTPDRQAKPGDYLTIYATGLGALDTAIETGAPAPTDRLVRMRQAPNVTLDGVPVPVVFAGLAPGFVGLNQINIQVPAAVASGNRTLIMSVGGADTAPMTVPIR